VRCCIRDIHGQFQDLSLLFRRYGDPNALSHMISFVFNGDFVDRGVQDLEVVLLLLALKLCKPEAIFLIRGNHECRPVNGADHHDEESFLSRCKSRLGRERGHQLWEEVRRR
jgi:hypothetical protein